eukprot:jgi/Undpi1/12819/HiC_scaffold_7.g02486.m1
MAEGGRRGETGVAVGGVGCDWADAERSRGYAGLGEDGAGRAVAKASPTQTLPHRAWLDVLVQSRAGYSPAATMPGRGLGVPPPWVPPARHGVHLRFHGAADSCASCDQGQKQHSSGGRDRSVERASPPFPARSVGAASVDQKAWLGSALGLANASLGRSISRDVRLKKMAETCEERGGSRSFLPDCGKSKVQEREFAPPRPLLLATR